MPPRICTVTPNPNLDRTLTVPDVRLDEVLRATESRVDPGGKGFNVSRALKGLGMESLAIAFLGGADGERLGALLAGHGVTPRAVPIADDTRTCYVVTDAAGSRHLKVNERGPFVAESEAAALFAAVAEEAQPDDLWVLAGSLARGLPDDFYERMVRLLRTRGARSVLDAGGEAMRLGLRALPFMIKPNALEAGELLSASVRTPAEAAVAAARLCDAGVEIVAISLGAEGLVLARGGELVHALPPLVQVHNAVGAGDATVAGMLWALAQGLSLIEMARWGAACGTTAAMRPGTDFGVLADVQAVATEVRVEPLGGR